MCGFLKPQRAPEIYVCLAPTGPTTLELSLGCRSCSWHGQLAFLVSVVLDLGGT